VQVRTASESPQEVNKSSASIGDGIISEVSCESALFLVCERLSLAACSSSKRTLSCSCSACNVVLQHDDMHVIYILDNCLLWTSF
jgi:hypothetical protein